MRRISKDTCNSILELIDNGLSSHRIAARLGVSHRTAGKVRAEARPYAQKRRAGRPAKLTAADKRWLARLVITGRVDNAVQLTRQLRNSTNVECSVQTVRRALKEAALKAMLKKKAETPVGAHPPAPRLRLGVPALDGRGLEARRLVR